jgi:ankyrin repeat protein
MDTTEAEEKVFVYQRALREINSEKKISDCLKFFSEKKEFINVTNGYSQKTLLHLAVLFGRAEEVYLFLQLGANVNAQDLYSDTPLLIALRMFRSKRANDMVSANIFANIARLLLNHHAYVNIKCTRPNDFQGFTPLHYGVLYQMDKDIIEKILELGANVNARNRMGNTPLDIAIQIQDEEIITLLLWHGSNMFAENRIRKPLDIVVKKGNEGVLKLFR